MVRPFATVQDYLDFQERASLFETRAKILEEANTALAWGMPDRESTGYSNSELLSIISRLVNYIKKSNSSLAQR